MPLPRPTVEAVDAWLAKRVRPGQGRRDGFQATDVAAAAGRLQDYSHDVCGTRS